MGIGGQKFDVEIGRRITLKYVDSRSASVLVQRMSVTIQRATLLVSLQLFAIDCEKVGIYNDMICLIVFRLL